jgi:hypothetical protein
VYTVTVTCIDCDTDAPGVGIDGYLGTPSLSTSPPVDPDDADAEQLPFGYLYEPLQAIRLRPRDLEEMGDFLRTHGRHEIVMWSDSQPDSTLPRALVALLARRASRRAKRQEERRGVVDNVVCVADEVETDWVFGHYSVRCLECRRKHTLEEPETLRSFDTQPLHRKAVGLMLSRWGKLAPDDGWNHALPPAIDPYGASMEGLLTFLKRHRTHSLEASVRAVGR